MSQASRRLYTCDAYFMIELRQDNELFVLDLGDGDQRFTPETISELHKVLTEVENVDGPRALVTVASGKIWHNGLDLDWIAKHKDNVPKYIASVHRLLARFLVSPIPTVACIQGHVFAAGAMLALVHDERIMRSDRGYFCLPEIDIQMPFTTGMVALVLAKLPPAVAHQAMVTGRRYGGDECAQLDIVGIAASESELPGFAFETARKMADKDAVTLGAIKRSANAATYESIMEIAYRIGDD
jgi:Delta3-Delta2-enoyl-CoA isomerase